MAKGTISLGAGIKAVKTLGKQMGAEAKADYKVALSASAAGQSNLATQRGRAQALFLGTEAATASKLRSLTQRAKAVQRGVTAQEAATTARYGTALGASVARAYGGAAATAAAGVLEAKGNVAMGGGIAAAGKTAMQFAKQEGMAQADAAKYALDQALQQRTIIDNQTLASLTGQLYQTALQYNEQFKLYKREQDLAAKNAGANKGNITRLTTEAPGIATGAADAVRAAVDAGQNPYSADSTFNIGTTAQTWAQANGYDPNGPEAQIFAATARNIIAGQNAPYAAQAALTTLYSGAPGFEKWGAPAVNAVAAGTQAQAHAAYLASQPDTSGGGGGGDLSQTAADQQAALSMSRTNSIADTTARLRSMGFSDDQIKRAIANVT